jgi:hypothetical protein
LKNDSFPKQKDLPPALAMTSTASQNDTPRTEENLYSLPFVVLKLEIEHSIVEKVIARTGDWSDFKSMGK